MMHSLIKFYNPENGYDFSGSKRMYYDYIVDKYNKLEDKDNINILTELLETSYYELIEHTKKDNIIIINRTEQEKQELVNCITYIYQYYVISTYSNICIECSAPKQIFTELTYEFTWLKQHLTQLELNVIFYDGCDTCKIPSLSTMFNIMDLITNDYTEYTKKILEFFTAN